MKLSAVNCIDFAGRSQQKTASFNATPVSQQQAPSGDRLALRFGGEKPGAYAGLWDWVEQCKSASDPLTLESVALAYGAILAEDPALDWAKEGLKRLSQNDSALVRAGVVKVYRSILLANPRLDWAQKGLEDLSQDSDWEVRVETTRAYGTILVADPTLDWAQDGLWRVAQDHNNYVLALLAGTYGRIQRAHPDLDYPIDKLRVLSVDNMRTVRRTAQRLLEQAGKWMSTS